MIDGLGRHPTSSSIIELGSLGPADSLGCFGYSSENGAKGEKREMGETYQNWRM